MMTDLASIGPMKSSLAADDLGNPVDVEFKADVDGSPQRYVEMLFDCYHMQIMEGDLTGHIRKNLDVIGHFHSAGHPGRHGLWLGENNYPFLVSNTPSGKNRRRGLLR